MKLPRIPITLVKLSFTLCCAVGAIQFSNHHCAVAQTVASDGTHTEEFLTALSEARAKNTSKQWNEAARLWEKVVQLNPVNGEYWYQLAEARYKAQDYRNSITAYEQAFKLGVGLPASRVRDVARCQLMLGEKDQALNSLERAFALGLSPARSDPRRPGVSITAQRA